MSLECSLDCDYYVDFRFVESYKVRQKVFFGQCIECESKLFFGSSYYVVREWILDDYADEQDLNFRVCCESCGDLAISFIELGYCWTYGDLRSDIKQINEYL